MHCHNNSNKPPESVSTLLLHTLKDGSICYIILGQYSLTNTYIDIFVHVPLSLTKIVIWVQL